MLQVKPSVSVVLGVAFGLAVITIPRLAYLAGFTEYARATEGEQTLAKAAEDGAKPPFFGPASLALTVGAGSAAAAAAYLLAKRLKRGS
ncbi:MAG: hypothetical protein JTT11_07675 [Candidatus Brockarchaeota archaeon]|nr:hypothetical protein [Candidatus Brockarchaeota archaeon]